MANVTRRTVITKALATEGIFTNEELEVFAKMLKGLDNKTAKVNKTTLENIGVRNEILALIADGRARTAKEIAEALGYTTNKVAGLLRPIVLDGKAEKVKGEKSKDACKYVGVADAEPYPMPEVEGEDA